MKNRRERNVLLVTLLSIFLLVFNILIKKHFISYAESIMAAFMLVIVFLSFQMYGFQKDKNTHLKSKLFYKTAQIITIYFIVIYLLGLYFGYSKIVFSLKPISIINNTFAPIIIFVCLEIFRYISTSANKDSKKNLIIVNSIIGLLELSITTRYLNLYNLETAYKTFADYIIPIGLKQVALGILCYNAGLKPSLLYRVVMVTYTYIIGIHPNFSETIVCMCNIVLPLIIISSALEIVDEEKREKEYITKKSNTSIIITSAALIMVIIAISGISPVGITAIASNSMSPSFSKGAAVITIKVKDNTLKEGDIITFNKQNKRIIHRIKRIEVINEEKRYYTQGDANRKLDKGYITSDDIENKVVVSIPLIGYPSIILHELLTQ